MEAEYYPPREDVILQNEASSDAYILVTGSVVSLERERGRESLLISQPTHSDFASVGRNSLQRSTDRIK